MATSQIQDQSVGTTKRRGHVIIKEMRRDKRGNPEKAEEVAESINFREGTTITRL